MLPSAVKEWLKGFSTVRHFLRVKEYLFPYFIKHWRHVVFGFILALGAFVALWLWLPPSVAVHMIRDSWIKEIVVRQECPSLENVDRLELTTVSPDAAADFPWLLALESQLREEAKRDKDLDEIRDFRVWFVESRDTKRCKAPFTVIVKSNYANGLSGWMYRRGLEQQEVRFTPVSRSVGQRQIEFRSGATSEPFKLLGVIRVTWSADHEDPEFDDAVRWEVK